MNPVKTLHTFDGPKYSVAFDTETEAIKHSDKYPLFLFRRIGNVYEANHSDYLNWLNQKEQLK